MPSQALKTAVGGRQHRQPQATGELDLGVLDAVGDDRGRRVIRSRSAIPAEGTVIPIEQVGEGVALRHAQETTELVPSVEPHLVEPLGDVSVAEQRDRTADVVGIDVGEYEQLDPRHRANPLGRQLRRPPARRSRRARSADRRLRRR